MSDVTIATITYRAEDALALMWESFLHFHPGPPPPWLVWDNGQGSYARARGAAVWDGNNSVECGVCMDRLIPYVKTRYVLFTEDDVEFGAPVLPDLLRAIGEEGFAAGYLNPSTGLGCVYGKNLPGSARIEPCCALYETERLQRFCRHLTFAHVINHHNSLFYDTGGLLLAFAQAAGWEVAACPWLFERIWHWGHVASSFRPDITATVEMRDTYTLIQEHLRALRAA